MSNKGDENILKEGDEVLKFPEGALSMIDNPVNVLGVLLGSVLDYSKNNPDAPKKIYYELAEEAEERIFDIVAEEVLKQVRIQDFFRLVSSFMAQGDQSFANWIKNSGARVSVDDEKLKELRTLRRDLLREEYWEYVHAEEKDDVVEIADGLIDIIVVSFGTLCSYFGVSRTRTMLLEIALSNLTKFEIGENGKSRAIKREDGKILKGKNYQAPNLKALLDCHADDLFDFSLADARARQAAGMDE